MKLHPRYHATESARLDVEKAIASAWTEYDLTPIEVVKILADLTSSYAKYPLRTERHPNDESKKADEA